MWKITQTLPLLHFLEIYYHSKDFFKEINTFIQYIAIKLIKIDSNDINNATKALF